MGHYLGQGPFGRTLGTPEGPGVGGGGVSGSLRDLCVADGCLGCALQGSPSLSHWELTTQHSLQSPREASPCRWTPRSSISTVWLIGQPGSEEHTAHAFPLISILEHTCAEAQTPGSRQAEWRAEHRQPTCTGAFQATCSSRVCQSADGSMAVPQSSPSLEHLMPLMMAFPGDQLVSRPPAMRETWVRSLGWDDPLRRKWQPTPVFLLGKSHGQRTLVSYSPRGHKKSNTTWH